GLGFDSENQVHIGELQKYEEEMAMELENKASAKVVSNRVTENLVRLEPKNDMDTVMNVAEDDLVDFRAVDTSKLVVPLVNDNRA
ncbi:hypothetical protein TorRG33x02_156030, partial [Trema orientale]